MKQYDSVVIGGGPAGVTAALYLLRSGANVAWVEKLAPGGQILLTEGIENYPGFPEGITGFELADKFEAHLKDFSMDRYLEEVLSMEIESGMITVKAGEETLQAKTAVLCTGAVFRKLGLPREKDFIGKGVSFCALCDGNFYRDKVVGVVGGGNTALEESLYLSKLVKKLHLIHRRDEFRADKIYHQKVLDNPVIEVHFSQEVEEIKGENEVEGVVLRSSKDKSKMTLDLDGLFIFIGYEAVSSYFPQGLNLDDKGFVVTDTEMATNLPGVFAAGDVRSKLCRQVTTAVGDGATAANSALLYLEKNNA